MKGFFYKCILQKIYLNKNQIFNCRESIYSFCHLLFFASTSNELLALEKAVCAWAEWESALRELQGALRGDMATLEALRDRPVIGDQTEVTAQIRQLAASLVDKKKVQSHGKLGLSLFSMARYSLGTLPKRK